METGTFRADIYCRDCQRVFPANLMDISEGHMPVCPHCHNRITEKYNGAENLPTSCLDEVLCHIRAMVNTN